MREELASPNTASKRCEQSLQLSPSLGLRGGDGERAGRRGRKLRSERGKYDKNKAYRRTVEGLNSLSPHRRNRGGKLGRRDARRRRR